MLFLWIDYSCGWTIWFKSSLFSLLKCLVKIFVKYPEQFLAQVYVLYIEWGTLLLSSISSGLNNMRSIGLYLWDRATQWASLDQKMGKFKLFVIFFLLKLGKSFLIVFPSIQIALFDLNKSIVNWQSSRGQEKPLTIIVSHRWSEPWSSLQMIKQAWNWFGPQSIAPFKMIFKPF